MCERYCYVPAPDCSLKSQGLWVFCLLGISSAAHIFDRFNNDNTNAIYAFVCQRGSMGDFDVIDS